jgi:hypothetical protein
MSSKIRLFVELAMAAAAWALFSLTLLWPAWIEAITHFDPDQSSGNLERSICVLSVIAAIGFSALARWEWVRSRSSLVT